MPSRTKACSSDSKYRGPRCWRFASALLLTGPLRALSATSITAVMARRPLRGKSDIPGPATPIRGPSRKPLPSRLEARAGNDRIGRSNGVFRPALWKTILCYAAPPLSPGTPLASLRAIGHAAARTVRRRQTHDKGRGPCCGPRGAADWRRWPGVRLQMLRAPRTSRFAIDPFKGHTDAL